VLGYTRHGPDVFVWIHRARLGRLALFSSPYWVGRRAEYDDEDDSTRFAAIFADTTCNLCRRDGGDLAHFCTTCTHPAMRRRRTDALGNGKWRVAVTAIAEAIHDAHRRAALPGYLRDAIGALDADSPEGTFITTRLITCSPWRATAADPTWTVAHRLGVMFDLPLKVGGHATRWADTWAHTAHTILSSIGAKWWTLLSAAERARLVAAGFDIPAAAR